MALIPLKIVRIPETDSTNRWMAGRVGVFEAPALVYAGRQTAGRGQRGNSWESEPGMNLTASALIFPEGIPPARQFLVSEAVALSVVDVLAEYGIDAMVKWPNDIYVGGRKICGILIENTVMGPRILHSVAGFGVNVNQTRFLSDAPNPVSMAQLAGKTFSVDEIAGRFAEVIPARMVMAATDPEGIHTDFMRRLWRGDGRSYPFLDRLKGVRFSGRIEGVDPDGILHIVSADGVSRSYAFKEVEFIL